MKTMSEVFADRERSIDQGLHDPVQNKDPVANRRAALIAKSRDRSDPFVYNRAMNYLRHGYFLADELSKTALSV